MATVVWLNEDGFMGMLKTTRAVWETYSVPPPGTRLEIWGYPVPTLVGFIKLVLGLNGPFWAAQAANNTAAAPTKPKVNHALQKRFILISRSSH